ncbi:hypothetical protein [Bradyrhizobium guangzhouense]|uniref:hypothetical protein n=1 Tax=Bradyrhizobium guangzhouense TaxID=1325095 RepID=UPI0010099830|nr:hypothetical protein [Bradyrhizobium guangzhouense]
MSDSSQAGPIPKIEELLARMASAGTPAEALEHAKDLAGLVEGLDPLKAIDVIAGLMTDPKFQANQVRLDFAVRIILGTSKGTRRPKRDELIELLNNQLEVARVAQLEDPIEDFFVESLPTRDGQFLIFSGTWEKASVHTELLLRAFSALPDGPPKRRAWKSAIALLRLSTALVERSQLKRGIVGDGAPYGTIEIPFDARLSALARRVRFSTEELASLNINIDDLEPLFFREEDSGPILFSPPGNSPLESRPLIKAKHGIVIGAPANLSTAIRSILTRTTVEYGLARQLQFNFLNAEAEYLYQSNFPCIPKGKTAFCDDQLYCEQLFEISTGRFLHVIFSVDGFAGWPDEAFASIKDTDLSWIEMLEASMLKAQSVAKASPNFVNGMTLWMCAGWGAGRRFGFTPTDTLNDWEFVAAEPADLATMNACKDGKPADLWRLRLQQTQVENQGFEFSLINGLLNLFHWWRITDHALFPPNQIDATPPLVVNFPSSLLLEARKEARDAFDRIALQDEQGRWHIVGRLEQEGSYAALKNAYASFDDVRVGNLTGVIVDEDRSNWWVRLDTTLHSKSRDIYETWKTVLVWAGQVMAPYLNSISKWKIRPTIAFLIKLEPSPSGFDFKPLTDAEIDVSIDLEVDTSSSLATLTLKTDWFRGFFRPDNYAERCLGLNLLLGASLLFGLEKPADELSSLVLAAVGSTDFRHRHALEIKRVIEQLSADGLVRSFKGISISAGALAKCGSAWRVRSREDGTKLTNKTECLRFLKSFIEDCTRRLIADIKPYHRTQFILTNMEGLQAAIAEEAHWRRSARALRAIHGVEEDFNMSMGKVMSANGVLRASSMLIELAAEAQPVGGLDIGTMDLQDFQARALQLFQTADMVPAYAADHIAPEIHLSPTGDILYDHDFHEAAIEEGAKKRHAEDRAQSSNEYIARFSKTPSRKALDENFSNAIQAEYGVPIEVFREFSDATARIARERKQGVFVLRRSELRDHLKTIEIVSDMDFLPLIDRLTLPCRRSFAEIPEGFGQRDIDLSKYDRRISLIARPIVSLSNDDDPLLAIAPGLIERTIAHNVSGALSGALQGQFWLSRQMIAYAGASGSQTGIDFNEAVSEGLQQLGLNASASVKPWACLNQKKTKELEELGDIDVLAINQAGTIVWVCEAKDLKLCRTIGEAAQRLSDYQGAMKDRKPDKLLRHLRRVEYMRANALHLAKQLKLESVPTVFGAVIVNAPQPMTHMVHRYVRDSTVVMLSEIANVPWDRGWPVS